VLNFLTEATGKRPARTTRPGTTPEDGRRGPPYVGRTPLWKAESVRKWQADPAWARLAERQSVNHKVTT
jgi:hypothetical protein